MNRSDIDCSWGQLILARVCIEKKNQINSSLDHEQRRNCETLEQCFLLQQTMDFYNIVM